MYKKALKAAVLSVAALALAGCHRTVNTVEVGDAAGSPQYRWIQTDSGLGSVAHVTSASKTRVNDLLRVQVEITNDRERQQRLYYRFEYLDADGMVVDTPLSTWQPIVIQGRETIKINGVAPNPRVTDCRLKLQESIR